MTTYRRMPSPRSNSNNSMLVRANAESPNRDLDEVGRSFRAEHQSSGMSQGSSITCRTTHPQQYSHTGTSRKIPLPDQRQTRPIHDTLKDAHQDGCSQPRCVPLLPPYTVPIPTIVRSNSNPIPSIQPWRRLAARAVRLTSLLPPASAA